MKIYLVRHGESLANVDLSVFRSTPNHAVPLSDRGREQATRAGEWLRDELGPNPPRFRLWNSPYHRARQTADLIQAAVGAPLADRHEHVLLCEQQFGIFDGVPDEELAQRFPAEYEHYDLCQRFEGRFWARMPLGESRFDVATRVHQAFGTFHRDAQRHGVDHLVVVCHGVTLRAFVMMWFNRSPEWFEREPNPHNCAIRLLDEEDRGYVYPGSWCSIPKVRPYPK